MLTLETNNFRPSHKNKVEFEPRTTNKSISIPTLKSSHSIPTPRTSQLCMPPDTKIKSIFFGPDSKTSHCRPPHETNSNLISTLKSTQLRSPALKSRRLGLPTQQPSKFRCQHWNHVSHFRAVLLCMLYIPVHALVIQQQFVKYNYEHQLVLFLTFPYYRNPPKIVRKYILRTIFGGLR